MGDSEGDTRSLDYGSCQPNMEPVGRRVQRERFQKGHGYWFKFPIIRGPIFGFPL